MESLKKKDGTKIEMETGNGAVPKSHTSRSYKLAPDKEQAFGFKNVNVFVLLFPLFLTIMGAQDGYGQVRQVNYCTVTRTYCAIPACVDEDSITDLDRVKMMYNDLLECTESAIDDDYHLTVTTYYPQRQRYEYDYQYMVGKSVVSEDGMFLYDHEGEEIMFQENTGFGENFIIPDEIVETFGLYNQTFEITIDEAIVNLGEVGFEAYESADSVIVGVSDRVEMSIDFNEFMIEMRFFEEEDGDKGLLKALHRTNCAVVDGYIIPIEETMVSYDTLPSEIPHQITRVKSYLFYQVIEDDDVIVSWGEVQPYDEYLNGLRKSVQKGENIEQFEEIQKRQTELKVFPNPAEERVTVSLPFYMNENLDIKVFNTKGVAVLTQHHTKGNEAELDIKSLPAGVYVVSCVRNNKIISTRFVKH